MAGPRRLAVAVSKARTNEVGIPYIAELSHSGALDVALNRRIIQFHKTRLFQPRHGPYDRKGRSLLLSLVLSRFADASGNAAALAAARTAINLRKSLRVFAKPYLIPKSRTKSPCLPQQAFRSMSVRLVRLSTKSSVT